MLQNAAEGSPKSRGRRWQGWHEAGEGHRELSSENPRHLRRSLKEAWSVRCQCPEGLTQRAVRLQRLQHFTGTLGTESHWKRFAWSMSPAGRSFPAWPGAGFFHGEVPSGDLGLLHARRVNTNVVLPRGIWHLPSMQDYWGISHPFLHGWRLPPSPGKRPFPHLSGLHHSLELTQEPAAEVDVGPRLQQDQLCLLIPKPAFPPDE